MAHWTTFAGLAAPEPGEGSTQVLNGEFVYRNPDLIDQLLRIGAVAHRHDGHAGLPSPTHPLTLAPGVAVGALNAATTYWMTYTAVDQYGGETLPAPPASAITGGQVDPPSFAPSAGVDFNGGIMPAGNYAYTLTYTDGKGGETPIGPVTWVYIDPGHASAEVQLVGLDAELTSHGGDASEWRMWRSYEGADWHLVTQSGASAFTDAGFDPPDNPARPPDGNTTGIVPGSLLMTLPSSDAAIASASSIKIYLSTIQDFYSPALFETVPIACAGTTISVTNAQTANGEPPHSNLSLPGAAKINGPTEVLGWQTLTVAASGGASASAPGKLTFKATGGASVAVQDLGGGSAVVTIGDADSAGAGQIQASANTGSGLVTSLAIGGTGVTTSFTDLGGGSGLVVVNDSGDSGGSASMATSTIARAYMNTLPAAYANGWNLIQLDTKEFDDNNLFDLAGGHARYVCPQTGKYQVNGQVLWNLKNTTEQHGYIAAYVNGTRVRNGEVKTVRGGVVADLHGNVLSTIVSCNAGDYIELYFNTDITTAGVPGGGDIQDNYLEVYRVS
jgi:hypothetical protein